MAADVSQTEGPLVADDELGAILRDYLNATRRLQRTHEMLREEILRLRRELASKDRELERRQRLAALGELAAGVAHEVRNPLGAIQLYSGLLRNQCLARGGLPEALKLIEKIEAGIRAIDGVVQDTLALAPRRSRLARQPLRRIVEGARDVCRAALRTKRLTLVTDYADARVRVLADRESLQRVIVNLIVNAAEASAANGQVAVRVGAEQAGLVELRVCDDGPGLPAEILEHIFDPFFTTKQHGTGLGLTIAHRVVEAHGGRLSARNRPGGGAEFVITLPAAGRDDGRQLAQKTARRPSAA